MKKIELFSYAFCGAELHFTSRKLGYDATIDLDDYAGVEERNGITYVSYYTGSEDCPTDSMKVMESVAEVTEIVNKAYKELSEFRDTVTTVDKGYLAALEKIAGKEAVEKLGH